MKGHLAYHFIVDGSATHCIQRQTFSVKGLMKLLEPIIKATFSRQMQKRLAGIKFVLEGEWKAA